MNAPSQDSVARVLMGVYRVALLSTPREFRQVFSVEMIETFRRRVADAKGHLPVSGLAWFCIRELWAVIRTGIRIRRETGRRRRSNPRRGDARDPFGQGNGMLDGISSDLKLALLGMKRAPGFTLAATLVLALGIGANTTAFSALKMAVFSAPPFPQAERMVMVDMLRKSGEDDPGRSNRWPLPMVLAVSDVEDRIIDPMAGFLPRAVTLTGMGPANRINTELVSAAYFDVVGLPMTLGRGFVAAEEDEGGPFRVTVVSHGFWRSRLGGSPSVLDQMLELNGERFRVVGVAPPGFSGLAGEADLWFPWGAAAVFRPGLRGQTYNHQVWVAGRLVPGASLDQAREQMRTIAEGLSDTWPSDRYGLSARMLEEVWVNPGARTSAKLLALAAAMVLLVACANLSALLLTRARKRVRAGAVRMALGASRWRLVRLYLVESLALASLGGAVGVVFAVVGIRLILTVWPERFLAGAGVGIRVVDPGLMTLDGSVLGFAILLVLATAMLVGVLPAFRASRGDVALDLKEGAGATRRSGRLVGLDTRAAMVGAQVALALILLIGVGLVGESLKRLLRVDEGFRTENLLTFDFSSPMSLPSIDVMDQSTMADRTTMAAGFDDLLVEQLTALPDVEAATVGCSVLTGFCGVQGVDAVDGRQLEESAPIGVITAREGYFETLGIPILNGRGFDDQDGVEGPSVVILSQSAAGAFFPDDDPVGRTLTLHSALPDRSEARIIGVVGDVLFAGPEGENLPVAYYSMRERRYANHAIVRTTGRPERAVRAIREGIFALDPTVAMSEVASMDQLVSRSMGDRRLILGLLGVFASVTVLLAAVGTWSVVGYSVADRRRELSLRKALGAEGWDLLRLVTRETNRAALLGLAVGMAGALVGTRLLESFLWETGARDPRTYALGLALLFVVVLTASYLPARRAAQLDPAASLKEE